MTIAELIAALTKVVEDGPHRAAMQVTYGQKLEPVNGGVIGRGHDGNAVLTLAPISLDQVGEF